MGDQLNWTPVFSTISFVARSKGKTYTVTWMPDAHSWLYDGRSFENVDMAKGAAQAEYNLTLMEPK